jgi:ATP-dependent HslUV protease, peptidase subunit HslV
MHATTIVAVLKDGSLAMAGDGQITFNNNMVMKHQAKKVRRIYHERVLAGFAGSVADALALIEKYETQLEKYQGNLKRAAVELAMEWRMDRALRRLEAMLLVGDEETLLMISGNGEVIEPDDGISAIGTGGAYALAAARALHRHTAMSAQQIVEEALKIAAEICVFTNDRIVVEKV